MWQPGWQCLKPSVLPFTSQTSPVQHCSSCGHLDCGPVAGLHRLSASAGRTPPSSTPMTSTPSTMAQRPAAPLSAMVPHPSAALPVTTLPIVCCFLYRMILILLSGCPGVLLESPRLRRSVRILGSQHPCHERQQLLQGAKMACLARDHMFDSADDACLCDIGRSVQLHHKRPLHGQRPFVCRGCCHPCLLVW